MWKRELLRNKLYALLLVGLSLPVMFLDGDATATVLMLFFAVPLFFAKENWIMGGSHSYAYQESRRKSVRRHTYQALKNIEAEEERFHKLLYAIFDICELADFEIEGRIVLVDKRSGKVWR